MREFGQISSKWHRPYPIHYKLKSVACQYQKVVSREAAPGTLAATKICHEKEPPTKAALKAKMVVAN
jgi:hypothetical protein